MAGNPEMCVRDEYRRIETPDSEGVTVSFTPARIHRLGYEMRRDSRFSSDQAKAFLTLYGTELRHTLEEAAKNFMRKKVGE
jgi:hypothetical protein